MPLNHFYKLGNLGCQLKDFTSKSFWNTWEWRLNSYEELNRTNHLCELVIKRSIYNQDNFSCDAQSLVWSEPSGFFDHMVHYHPDVGTVWSFFRRKNNYLYLQYVVSPKWDEITLLTDETNSDGHLVFEYLGLIIPHVLLNHQTLNFHGVLMEHEGCGIIISAPSGTGKTTHARMWRDIKNALIINGDRATCRKIDGVWTGFGLPWSGTSGEQINRSVPLTALVVLERGEQNEAHRITGLEAFGAIWPHVQYPCWDEKLVGKALDLTDDFLNHIPIIRLQCRPDAEAVDVLAQALEEL